EGSRIVLRAPPHCLLSDRLIPVPKSDRTPAGTMTGSVRRKTPLPSRHRQTAVRTLPRKMPSLRTALQRRSLPYSPPPRRKCPVKNAAYPSYRPYSSPGPRPVRRPVTLLPVPYGNPHPGRPVRLRNLSVPRLLPYHPDSLF